MHGVKVEEEGVAVIKLRMDDGGSNGGSSFEVEHGSDTAEVAEVHETGAREV